MIRDLVLYPDPRLRARCAPVEKVTEEVRAIAADMVDTMLYEGRGIGLGAVQIGEMVRIITLCPPVEGQRATPRIFINPVLSDPSEERETQEEGTLSLPGVRGMVERPTAITIKALGLEGECIEERLTGLEARIAMHENDHINGVLFIDRLSRAERKRIEPLLRRIRKAHKG